MRADFTAMHCENIALLPHEILITDAMDHKERLMEVHTFQRFFTYQIPTSEDHDMNVVKTRFDPTDHHASQLGSISSTNDMVLRLRAQYRTQHADYVDQGMKVSVIEEATGTVVVDGSTEDHDE